MNRMKRASLFSISLGLLVAACGGDDTGGTTTGGEGGSNCDTAGVTTASATSAATTTVSAGTGGTGGIAAGGAGGVGGDGTGGEGGAPAIVPDLDPWLFWYHDNREIIDAFIDTKNSRSPGYDPLNKPVAVFDWDNTVIKNDIGDAVMFWMLQNSLVYQPPNKDWSLTSPFLLPAAVSALKAACDAAADPLQPLALGAYPACADEIAKIYTTGTTTDGVMSPLAFGGYNPSWMEPTYAWAVQLQKGHTPAQIAVFTEAAITAALAAPIGAKQTIGTVAGFNAYIRVYAQIKDLVGVLQDNGYDVWVLSASSQYIVEPFAAKVGVDASRVIGVRMVLDAEGKVTYGIQGCGPVMDGENTMITYIDGKRCWMNKVIYADASATALDVNPDLTKRPVFSAGDSDTDVSFLKDTQGMKLVINRNKKKLMCNAYSNVNGTGHWVVNPMFIDPKGPQAAPYPCSTLCGGMPCLDENDTPMADQLDTVFCKNGVYCDP
jgi:phosphoserine phosphatase